MSVLFMVLGVVSLLGNPGESEVYSSFMNVQNLNNLEDDLLDLLKNYISSERDRLDKLEDYYHYVFDAKAGKNAAEYISYPTNQFNVIHRFVKDWNNLEDYVHETLEGPLFKAMSEYSSDLPDEKDVEGAIKALHRLQDIYKVSAEHFANGYPLGDGITGQPLDVKTLLTLTKSAYNQDDWRRCAAWGRQAHDLLKDKDLYSPMSHTYFDLFDHYIYCLYKIGEMTYSLELTEDLLVYYPDHQRLLGNAEYFRKEITKNNPENDPIYSRSKRGLVERPFVSLGEVSESEDVEITYIPKSYPGADSPNMTEDDIEEFIEDTTYKYWKLRMKKYRSLCKESAPLSPEIKVQIDRLICYYKSDTPRIILKPVKVEVAWPSPRILIFHDIVSDEEADYIMELAKPYLNRATVHNKVTGKLENADYRVSKTAWLDMDLPLDTEDIVRRVNRRMEDATELSLEMAELQQVNNYGMAGHYEPHYDMKTKRDIETQGGVRHEGGNRVATLLIYFGDTMAGGATVFTDAGARLTPVKVNNYGMAGQYEPHYDMATRGEKAFKDSDGGNRIATLLFYMGNTEAGGATVFIDAGARIAPQKNAAVFWYNLLPSGDPDLLTRHAGCPVLAGTKWVMNKWIHVNDQMFTRPCGLDEFTREKPAKLYHGQYTQ